MLQCIMDNRKCGFSAFDKFVERVDVKDLSELAIFLALMKQGNAYSEVPQCSKTPVLTMCWSSFLFLFMRTWNWVPLVVNWF